MAVNNSHNPWPSFPCRGMAFYLKGPGFSVTGSHQTLTLFVNKHFKECPVYYVDNGKDAKISFSPNPAIEEKVKRIIQTESEFRFLVYNTFQ